MTERVPRIHPGDGDPRHGTENGYNNLFCKCVDCKRAHAAASYDRKVRWRRKRGMVARAEIPLKPCGTLAAYRRGCKCEDCKKASVEHRAKYPRKPAKRTIEAVAA